MNILNHYDLDLLLAPVSLCVHPRKNSRHMGKINGDLD